MSGMTSRRLTTVDCLIFIAATAIALLPTSVNWAGAFPILCKVPADLSDRGFDRVFAAVPRTGRIDSFGMMGVYTAGPLIGVSWKLMFPPEYSIEVWIATRTTSGRATGYAASQEAYVLLFPILACFSVALLFCRILRPRPDRATLWRQPGWWASFAVTISIVAGAALDSYAQLRVPTVVAPAAVLVAWLTLWAARKWSADKTWVDRLGRFLGVCWIVVIPLYVVGFMLI
jgi:hypothetical protein